jgi:hypothetical protein
LEPLTEKETHLIRWFEENEPRVSEAVKAAIIRWCSATSLDRLSTFDCDDGFPVIDGEEELKKTWACTP